MSGVSRRAFVAAGLASLPGLAGLPRRLLALDGAPRMLNLLHAQTGERLQVEYHLAGTYVPEALEVVDHFLRDFRTDEVHPIDPALLDLLNQLRLVTGSSHPFQVISGYRSPRTNAALRERGAGGVAVGSLHMVGKAIDIRLEDVPLSRLRSAALGLHAGGVGYYPGLAFVHVDTGRVRQWSG